MKQCWHIIILIHLIAFVTGVAFAQKNEPTVYASVLSSGLFIVGAANSNTGLFYQRMDEDTVWHHTGATRIRAFGMATVQASKGKRLYIASGNGVHKTTDAGESWRITTDWRTAEIMCLAIDPKNENILFASTPYGVFKSTDAAGSWNEASRGLEKSKFVSAVIIDSKSSSTVFCSTEDGVYKSTNGGGSWYRLDLHVSGIRTIRQSPADGSIIAVGTEDDGIFISSDRGRSWQKSRNGLGQSTFYTVAFDPRDSRIIYAGGFQTGVYKSVNGGASWKQMNEGLTNLNVHGIAVDPTNTKRLYAATIWGGVFRSDDAGEHWRYAGLFASQVWDVRIEPFSH